MLRKRRTKSAKFYLAVAVLLVLHVTHIEASPLKKNARRDEQKRVTYKPSDFRPGVILFGQGLKNNSVEDDAAYQADASGLERAKMFALFQRMNPLLTCGPNQMRLRASGPPARHFSLNQHSPMPLSHVPSTCGYNMPRNPFGLVLNVPYDGCNVVIQDGNHYLPLLWNGIPVTLKCTGPYGSTTTVAPTPTLPPWADIFSQMPPGLLHHLLHQMPSLWPYYWQWLQQQGQTTTTTTPPQDQLPSDFLVFYLQWLIQQSQSTTASPVMQPPSDFWQYFLHMHKGFPFPSQPTTLPQGPPPQLPSDFLFYWQWLMQQGQPTTASPPQNPSNIWQYWQNWHPSHPFPHPNQWHVYKGTVSPSNPQTPWFPTQTPWFPTQTPWFPTQMPWVFPTTTASMTTTPPWTSAAHTNSQTTLWWYMP